MINYIIENVEKFCVQIGIDGKLQSMLKSAIKTESQFSKFKQFILDNDNIKSKLQLVSNYLMSINLIEEYPKSSFVEDFQNGNKVYALEFISKGHYNNSVLHKVESLLKKDLTLENLYDKVVNENRLNINNILILLEK